MPKALVADKRLEDNDSLPRATGMIVSIVQHDADAWSAPSFLRSKPPSSTNTKTTKSTSSTNALPHALGQSNAANMNSTDQRLKTSLSREGSISRHRHPPADQNQDPTAPRAPQEQSKKLALMAKETPPALASTTSQSRLNKRRNDTTSDTADLSLHAKRRRVGVEQTATINDTRAEKKIGYVIPSLKAVEHGGRKLNGYTPNLSKIVLGDQPQPLVSWWYLRDILLKTSRDRNEGTRLRSA